MGLANFLGPLYLLGMDGLCLESTRLLFFQESAGGDGRGADSLPNWSVDVEELVDRGDVDGAIALLDSVVAALDRCSSGSATSPAPDLRLAYALTDLAGL